MRIPLRPLPRLALLVLTLLFAGWCVKSLRGDLAQLSFAPLLRSWEVVAAAVALSLINYGVRVMRWRSYLAKLGHTFPLRFLALTYVAGFAYTLSPGKVGEIVRARYYVPRGVRLSEITAAFFAERLLDIVAMLALASLLLTTATRFKGFLALVAVLVVGVLAAVSVLPWQTIAQRLAATGRLPTRLRDGMVGLVSTLVSTRPLLRPGMLAAGFAAGLLAWGLEGAGLGLLGTIYPHVSLPLLSAVGVYGIVGGLSFLPGGLGSTEAAMTGLLVTHGYSVSEGILLTLTCRLVTLWLGVCVGWIAMLVLRHGPLAAVEA
jgi:glycosyltransferase 2 family protein